MIKITLPNGMELVADTVREGVEFITALNAPPAPPSMPHVYKNGVAIHWDSRGNPVMAPRSPSPAPLPIPTTIVLFTRDDIIANPKLGKGKIPVGIWRDNEAGAWRTYYAEITDYAKRRVRYFPKEDEPLIKDETVKWLWGNASTDNEVAEAKDAIRGFITMWW